jgi:hypothetical protein
MQCGHADVAIGDRRDRATVVVDDRHEAEVVIPHLPRSDRQWLVAPADLHLSRHHIRDLHRKLLVE